MTHIACTNVNHKHHPWNIRVAPPISWILRAAQDTGGFWRLKPSLNSVSEVIWLTMKFHNFFYFFIKFSNFHVHGSNLRTARTLSITFSEADTCTIRNYTLTAGAGQKDTENELQNPENEAKAWPKSINTYRPWLIQIAGGRRAILLEKVPTWGLDRLTKAY